MNIFVLGGTGMAGHIISLYFKEKGHDVTCFTRKKINYCKNIIGDVTDFDNLKKIILQNKYDAVINAVGVLNENAEFDKANAILLNSYLPHFLSQLTKDTKTKIVHISTDCVFSGKVGHYIESSFKDGESFYDRSKALGEIENNKDLTFRTSIVGPDLNENGFGLLNWFLKQNQPVNGYTNVFWTGITTLTLAKAIEVALYENINGLFNLVNNISISKFELLKLFDLFIKKSKQQIIPFDKIALNKSLINTRTDFSFKVPSYNEMMFELDYWIKKYIHLYPHYK